MSVFINFTGADRKLAEEIANALIYAGIRTGTGYDDSFKPGIDYASSVLDALEKAECIVTLWTPRSINSDWVIAESKVGFKRGTLLPIAIGVSFADVPPPFNQVQTFVTQGDDLNPDEFAPLIRLVQGHLANRRKFVANRRKSAPASPLPRASEPEGDLAPPRTPKAFVSYATEDEEIAIELVRHLEDRDCPCWVSFRDVDAGEDYRESITAVMPKVKFLVLLYSAHANTSFDIGTELLLARKWNKSRFVVKIDDAEPRGPVEYELLSIQSVDGRKDRTKAFEKIAQRARLL